MSSNNSCLGCNIFAYCSNNVVNYYDKTGLDAIWIQESGSAKGQGHSGLMVQDDEDNWFYFYWGPEDEDEDIVMLINGVDNGSFVQEIETNGADMRDIEALCAALSDAGGNAGGRASKITSVFYFEGDYTPTLEAVREMVASGEKYSLLFNNCLQKTTEAFIASDSRFKLVNNGKLSWIHPNIAAIRVAMISTENEALPWLLLAFDIFVNEMLGLV